MDALSRTVLRVEYEAETASFRYPHFVIGRQPTFRLPPPSTIYGHIASALGAPFDPRGVRFAYRFFHAGSTFSDVETSHKTTVFSTSRRVTKKYGFQPNVEVQTEPLERELLFRPRLTLYLDAPRELRARISSAFRAPRYPVLLGRSQDLGQYRSVDEITLERSDKGYFDHTILPHAYAGSTRAGILVLMPRFIDPETRIPSWGQYLQYETRGPAVDEDDPRRPDCVVKIGKKEELFDVDASARHPKLQGGRILVWHDFAGG
jgi:CRISPR-associated protein Cas5t